MDGALHELGDHIATSLPDVVTGFEVRLDELTVTAHAENIVRLLKFLRDNTACQCQQLIDVCGADYPSRPLRFDVVYHLLSLTHNHRVRVKVQTDEDTPVPSVIEIFASASWFERECWDLYGVMFTGHPDLRRILTDYGFQGFPLRKDFPLTGYVEVRYSEEQKRVVYEPVSLMQEFRNFDFMSPWEGARYILPGDEKAAGQDGVGTGGKQG